MAAVAQSIRRSAIGLGLFAVITGGTIAVTQVATEERIREQAARAEAQALYEIIPESQHNKWTVYTSDAADRTMRVSLGRDIDT